METVEKFFARCDQDFLTDCRIVAHSCTDAETVGMAAKVENRNIHFIIVTDEYLSVRGLDTTKLIEYMNPLTVINRFPPRLLA